MTKPTGRPAGRPAGSRSCRTAEVRELLSRLENEDRLHPARVFEALERKALSDSPDSVAAARLLLSYTFGAPRQMIDVSAGHELGTSWQEVLLRVVSGEQARQRREELDEWRLARALTAGAEQITE
jgi:hypothetical protein